jgi:hypothetical protein
VTWKSDNGNENASDVRITSNNGLESITLAAIAAAITTFKTTGTYTIDLKVNHQPAPAINLRKLLKLKHNSTPPKTESKDFKI